MIGNFSFAASGAPPQSLIEIEAAAARREYSEGARWQRDFTLLMGRVRFPFFSGDRVPVRQAELEALLGGASSLRLAVEAGGLRRLLGEAVKAQGMIGSPNGSLSSKLSEALGAGAKEGQKVETVTPRVGYSTPVSRADDMVNMLLALLEWR